jgi:hypothetical protein
MLRKAVIQRATPLFWLSLIGILICLNAPLVAGPINAGYLSYDVLLDPAPGFPGTNHFQIWNLTGDPAVGGQALAPDFPIYAPIVFTNAALSILIGNAVQTLPLGDLSPGTFSSAALQFSSDTLIQSATLTATINPLLFKLSTLEQYLASSSQISVTLQPSSGDDLQAAADLAVIAIDANLQPQPSDVPEPASFALAGSALTLVLVRMLWARARR